ncbi:MAG: aspartate 1-decarboxylase [Clostridia bacterium]|nr:aspartate 1-decarboxylase [Clostridia bacterium]
MWRTLFRSKIHRATVTEANLAYEGSLTLDADLLEAADFVPWEKVQVVNVTTGARLETYVIPGPRGSGVVCLNGGAARLGQPGDTVILIAYAQVSDEELASFRSRVVLVDAANRVREVRETSLGEVLSEIFMKA